MQLNDVQLNDVQLNDVQLNDVQQITCKLDTKDHWVFAPNSDFNFLILSQPNVVYLFGSNNLSLKYQRSKISDCTGIGIRNFVFVWNT